MPQWLTSVLMSMLSLAGSASSSILPSQSSSIPLQSSTVVQPPSGLGVPVSGPASTGFDYLKFFSHLSKSAGARMFHANHTVTNTVM